MISEKAFATYFSTFWKAQLPNLESLVRTLNIAGYERQFRPLSTSELSDRRDLVSETGFRLFGLSYPWSEAEDLVDDAAVLAVQYLDFHHDLPLGYREKAEAIEIARRIAKFGESVPGELEFLPTLPGHGMVASCQADLSIGETVVEIKYVDRSFRSTDFRQALCYCALRHFASEPPFSEICLLNPLRGVSVSISVDDLVLKASGRQPADLFQDLSYALSSGEISR